MAHLDKVEKAEEKSEKQQPSSKFRMQEPLCQLDIVVVGCGFCSAVVGRQFSGSVSSTNEGQSDTPELRYSSVSLYFT